jgi:hypothetical protein
MEFFIGMGTGIGIMAATWYFFGGGKAELQAKVAQLEADKIDLQSRLMAAIKSKV